jgi:glycosyltransferase involved in cell wall biosynthesis
MIVYASHDGGSGCAWYRMLVPLRAVDKLCDDVTVHFRAGGPRMMKEQHPQLLVTEAQEADVIVAQRANSIEGMGVWRRFSTPWCRTVYENDDDIWNITYENKAAYESYADGGAAREVMLRLISTSNMSTVSTPYLGDKVRELTGWGTNVVVLPNYIPEYVLDMKHDERNGRPRLGWMGGASHARDILQATSAVRRFMKRFPSWDLVVNGTDYRDDFKVARDRAYHVPWIHVCDDPDVFYRMIDFDIGICPLLDTEFARSKSHIKPLEYMARGIPVVASDVEPYRHFIDHGVNGFLVKQGQEHEWLRYLSELGGSTDLRLKMGEAAKAKAREHTIEKNYMKWVDAYKSMFPSGWEFKG